MAEKGLHPTIRVIVGLLVAVGAGCAWHFWHIDGFLAFLIAAAGLSLSGVHV